MEDHKEQQTKSSQNQDIIPTEPAEKTFTQSELDTIIGKRLAKAMKGMPDEKELSQFRAWKESQQNEQEHIAQITRERDEGNAALSKAQEELQQLKRERYVFSKGLSGDEAEFIVFKASKMVDDKTTFEQAVDTLAENYQKKPSFDWTAPVGNSSKPKNINDTMNELIRSAFN